MALIKNLTLQGVDLVVRGEAKDGVPPTAHIGPGQTKDVDADLESARVKGFVLAGALEIIDASPLQPGRRIDVIIDERIAAAMDSPRGIEAMRGSSVPARAALGEKILSSEQQRIVADAIAASDPPKPEPEKGN